ncbi:MAG: NAD-dependent succinate-semialdehyde dehydrogenase [Saprospiraceae bacterium]|jgi:succinate-semialdehyde dehydrogenase/glutarate-semialdehyde dehydrogenase
MIPDLKAPGLWKTRAYIGGEWLSARNGAVFPVTNPATGAVLAEVPDLGVLETQEAISAAHRAFPEWRSKTAGARAVLLRGWFERMIAHQEDLGRILTAEQGKPLAEAIGEIRYGASFVEWFAEEARRSYGDIIPGHEADKRIMVLRQPVGVAGIITPWNFPNAMIARKVAPALAAGCTVVVKPAEATPLSALAMAALAEEAGIPAGVLNIVTASNPTVVGGTLTESPLVRKLSFTGSTRVGKMLMAQCAGTLKRLSLELGGNAPFIVFEDADLDAAVEGAIASKYRNAGQTCVCANRFFVHEKIADTFALRLAAAAKGLNVGDGSAPGTHIGPLINPAARDKVERLLADAEAKGARILCGGKRHALGGTFFEPTVLLGARMDMALAKEEIFGPVAPIFTFSDDEAVVRMANDTEYGLAAYFYSNDVGRIFRVAEAMEYGIIGINTGLVSTAVAPFGGMKASGFGREGSKYGMDEFLEKKYLCLKV